MPCSARYCASSASVYIPRRRALLPRPAITAIAIRPFAKWWIIAGAKMTSGPHRSRVVAANSFLIVGIRPIFRCHGFMVLPG